MPPRKTKASAGRPERTVAAFAEGEPAPVVRRAPFADSPNVGARGQRTQQRILDAALRVFGEDGYHQCSIDRIAKLAGCSRVSFYQYFSGKEDVFRNLTGQVARQMNASTEALDPITPDADGWATLRAWVDRHTEIYDRYEPVFHSFPAAAESDETVASGSVRVGQRTVALIRSRLVPSDLPDRQLDPMLAMLFGMTTRMIEVAGILRSVAAEAYRPGRVGDAITDIVHRSLFGVVADVNVHTPRDAVMPTFEFSADMWAALRQDGASAEDAPTNRRALAALLASGRDVFIARGYHGTRVDDLADAAGISHGAFYRYFSNKEELARLFVVRAIRSVSSAFDEIPDVSADGANGQAALRRWLRRYNAVFLHEASMLRVWIDATLQDPSLMVDSVPAMDWGRRRMVRFLSPRGFGDLEMEALVMTALISAFGSEARTPSEVDAGARIIERGFLGR